MASVIFLVFFTDEMRPRMALDLPSMVGPVCVGREGIWLALVLVYGFKFTSNDLIPNQSIE